MIQVYLKDSETMNKVKPVLETECTFRDLTLIFFLTFEVGNTIFFFNFFFFNQGYIGQWHKYSV